MNEAREDVLAYSCGEDFVYYQLPQQHWKKVWSTNLLERVNVAPRDELCEADHKAPVQDRRYLHKSRGDYTPGGRGVAGAGRALAAGGPPHVLRRKHGRHPGAGGSAGPAHPRMRGATPSTRAVL